jgi:hypothetical protein
MQINSISNNSPLWLKNIHKRNTKVNPTTESILKSREQLQKLLRAMYYIMLMQLYIRNDMILMMDTLNYRKSVDVNA